MTAKTLLMLAAAALLLAAGCATAPKAAGPEAAEAGTSDQTGQEREELTLTTADGFSLAATYYPSLADGTKGMALLHMLGKDRSTWTVFALRAQTLGYHVIAIDLRGHGENDGSWNDFSDDDFNAAVNDVEAAVAALKERGASEIALAGASIGANLALRYAAENDVMAVVLLSPGLEYHGVRTDDAIAAATEPLFIAVAEGDSYAAESSHALQEKGSGVTLAAKAGKKHGTDMFSSDPALETEIFDWLEEQFP